MEESIAGWIGGVSGTIVGQPLDTIKCRLQTQGVSGRSVRYNGPSDCFVDIIRTEGARGLYKGLVPPIIGYGAMNALIFGAYGYSMSYFQPDGGRARISSMVLSSSVAAMVQTPVASITELLKLRMQNQAIGKAYQAHMFAQHSSDSLKGPIQMAVMIYRQAGLQGLCKGMMITTQRDIIAYAAYFLTYEMLCQWFAGENTLNGLSYGVLAISGGIAGMATWASCFPLDVVKSRLQIDGVDCKPEYRGIIDCFKKSYHAKGWTVFYSGLGVTLLRAFPVNAVTFCTVTLILRIIKENNREHSVL